MLTVAKNILVGILFVILASPMAFKGSRFLFGDWVASADGVPETAGLLIQALILTIFVKTLSNGEGYARRRKTPLEAARDTEALRQRQQREAEDRATAARAKAARYAAESKKAESARAKAASDARAAEARANAKEKIRARARAERDAAYRDRDASRDNERIKSGKAAVARSRANNAATESTVADRNAAKSRDATAAAHKLVVSLENKQKK